MSNLRFQFSLLAAAACTAAVACTAGPASEDVAPSEDAISSNDGTVLELRFTGEVIASAEDTPRKAVATQLQYVQGILMSDVGANAQVNMPTLKIVSETTKGNKKAISYDAVLTVVWPKGRETPKTYELALPKDVTALEAFLRKYHGTCGRAKYTDTFWHKFNPAASTCQLDAADVTRAQATVALHPQTTEGKYPEYDKIWEDDVLDIVAVFGFVRSGIPSGRDEGGLGRNAFIANVTSSLTGVERVEAPQPIIPSGVWADSTVTGHIMIAERSRRVNLRAFLVRNVDLATDVFERQYADATAKADFIVYEGPSAFGRNINKITRHTGATAGKYQLMYLYGGETLAYLDPAMHQKRIALNGATSDPEGTKFLDVVTTALPAFSDSGRSTSAFYRALLDASSPKTFNELMSGLSTTHLLTVFGEHDNTFKP